MNYMGAGGSLSLCKVHNKEQYTDRNDIMINLFNDPGKKYLVLGYVIVEHRLDCTEENITLTPNALELGTCS